MSKYLDETGLTHLWGKIKAAIASASSSISIPINGIKSGEKVLSLDSNENLQTTLSLSYDSTSQKVQLKGISNEVISEFDASVFVKDAFLNSATLVVVSSSQAGTSGFPAAAGTYLKFEWNLTQSGGGVDITWVNVTTLIDEYTAGNGINISGNAVSIKVDPTQGSNVTVSTSASGLKVEVDQSGKVDKVTGKDLSTNDYTDAEKTKLAGIAAGATADSALSNAEIDAAIAAAEQAGAA